MEQFDRDVARVACLEDDLRRRMYLFARRQRRGVRRDEVARALGVSRKLAAFHLDKLADAGLLTYHFARPPGRSGPGAGRPAKIYEPSDVEIELSIPARRYDLLGRFLVDAIRTEPDADRARDRAATTAFEAGSSLGQAVRRERALRPPGAERTLSVASEVLDEHGFETSREGNEVELRNCPFHALARHAPDLVCIMNHAFVQGLVRGLGNNNVDVRLEPTEGRCCVKLRSPAKNARQ
jgi:predicted ArsR family transcriptional regulator